MATLQPCNLATPAATFVGPRKRGKGRVAAVEPLAVKTLRGLSRAALYELLRDYARRAAGVEAELDESGAKWLFDVAVTLKRLRAQGLSGRE